MRYRPGPFQYSQTQMWFHVFRLVPIMLTNRMAQGRYLDMLVTHAPANGIHDKDDLPHKGIKAFRWLLKVFEPAYHIHGHIHIYRPDEPRETIFRATRVINAYSFNEIELVFPSLTEFAKD